MVVGLFSSIAAPKEAGGVSAKIKIAPLHRDVGPGRLSPIKPFNLN